MSSFVFSLSFLLCLSFYFFPYNYFFALATLTSFFFLRNSLYHSSRYTDDSFLSFFTNSFHTFVELFFPLIFFSFSNSFQTFIKLLPTPFLLYTWFFFTLFIKLFFLLLFSFLDPFNASINFLFPLFTHLSFYAFPSLFPSLLINMQEQTRDQEVGCGVCEQTTLPIFVRKGLGRILGEGEEGGGRA